MTSIIMDKVVQIDEVKPEKSNSKKKREDKLRRRDNRALENILKTINPLMDPEKIQVLKTRYSELYDEHRTLQNSVAILEKKNASLQREKEQLRAEHSRSVMARSRLESLCRELQRQNKVIKEENVVKIRKEEELRKEVASKLQSSLAEVTNMVQENNEKNLKLRDDSLDMANKIATLCQEFEKGEKELARMSNQIELEKKISEATVAKAHFELRAERELWLKEKEILQNKLKNSEETCLQLQNNVKALGTHLQMYTGKYEEFEKTIGKSNEVFDSCKSEMLKMTKQINTLEKDLKVWKSRWEKNAKTVLELTAAKQMQDVELGNSEKKIEQLQKLCRQLQVDRAAYLKLLKSNGIEPSSQICIDTNPTINNIQQQQQQQQQQPKPTKKEQELEMLKNNLKVLQEQFVGLTTSSDVKAIETLLNENAAADSNGSNVVGEVCDVKQELSEQHTTIDNVSN